MKKYAILLLLISFVAAIFAQQTPEQIAALQKQYQTTLRDKDNGFTEVYNAVLKQIDNEKDNVPNCAVWHNYMAELLSSYWEYEQYKIMNRTAIEGEVPADPEVWDARTLQMQIIYHYRQSLMHTAELAVVSIQQFKPILNKEQSVEYRPTLYDFLAFQALDFLDDGLQSMPIPEVPFNPNSEDFWASNEQFAEMAIASPDTLSAQYLTLCIMQSLTKLHLHDADARALLEVTLQRFRFLNDKSSLDNRSELYLAQLLQLEKQNHNRSGVEMVTYALGQFYQKRGDTYDENLHPEYKNDYAAACSWYQQTIDLAPQTIEAKNAQNALNSLKQSSISIVYMSSMSVISRNLVTFTTNNCPTVRFRIVPLTDNEYETYDKLYATSEQFKFILGKHPVFEQTFDIPDEKDYRSKKSHFMLPELKAGRYLLVATNGPFTAQNTEAVTIQSVRISNIACTYKQMGDDYEFFVYDRSTGYPIANADIEIGYYESYNFNRCLSKRSLKTSADGKFDCSFQNCTSVVRIVAKHGDDSNVLFSRRLFGSYPSQDTIVHHTDYLFTDRSIYRPGQTVYFKGIATESRTVDGLELEKQLRVEADNVVTLLDANQQQVERLELKTNSYGSFSGSFELPTSGLAGVYTIRSDRGSCNIRVEEYKRPTFEITVEQPTEEFKVGDTVRVKGSVRAFAGYAIDGATVKYSVQREATYPWWRCWWWRPESSVQQICSGTTTTNADGEFTVDFTAQPDLTARQFSPLYNYAVTVDVTDITGETHSEKTNVLVSDKTLIINSEVPETMETGKPSKVMVKVTNLAGKSQPSEVRYRIDLLKTPDNYMNECSTADYYLTDSATLAKMMPYWDFGRQRNSSTWPVLKTVSEGVLSVDGLTEMPLPDLKKLPEGNYRITFRVNDRSGIEIQDVKHFTLPHSNSKKCFVYQPIWVKTNAKQLVPGDTLRVTIGSYLQNAYIQYDVWSNCQLVASRTVKLNRGFSEFTLPITSEFLGEISVYAFTAQNNLVFSEEWVGEVKDQSEDIDFEFITFRDKTLPGSEEQYLIKLKDYKGRKVTAELLCSMYDCSLDELTAGPSWNSNIYINYVYPRRNKCSYTKDNTVFRTSTALTLGKGNYWNAVEFRTYPDWAYYPHYQHILRFCTNSLKAANFEEDMDASWGELVLYEPVLNDANNTAAEPMAKARVQLDETVQEQSQESSSGVRTNFAETAFFYPHLQTDEEGNVLIRFKMPESLTRWKLQGYAHDGYLEHGYFAKFVQTSKKLMVVPNAPRFLREGDTLMFSAKIVNTDSVTQCGNVKLTLRNALDNSLLNIIDGATVLPFEVRQNQSCEVHFRLVVPFNVGAVTYRIEATNIETPAFTDGEEATLPVLTNRILVTESMPLHISGVGHKQFVFNRLKNSFVNASPTLSTQSLTLEFTPNPIWYAIQAMPYLMEYPYECNEQMFSRYYANTLASNIVQDHPKVQEVFEQWQNEMPDAFCSQLEKNEELKGVLLEETPWLLDAQNESNNKKNIALLFDLQRMSKEQKAVEQKLQTRQNGDGGWSWFAGGPSSTYITEHIVAGIGHLTALHVPTELATGETLKKALQYIDNEMNDYYQKYLKKHPKCGATDIHYLYARSYHLNIPVRATCKTAYNYNYQNIKQNWQQQSIYMQGMIALICYRNGDVALAKQIVANIKSRAQYDEELGMYWAQHGISCYWHSAPIERQTLLIEAFNTITNDTKSVEQMQLWLLKQKQTKSWPTTKSTTEAIYALLLNNDQLDNCEGVRLDVGNWHYTESDTTTGAEAGTGYFKQTWAGAQVTADKATVKIEKQTAGPAWGGLYWQYIENADKVEHSQDGKFGIQKQLYRVTVGDRGEVLTPITEQTPLHVGDRVRVRVEIRSDRDMEYVHLKDMRAACFEPINVLSGYKHQDGLWYYESTRDAATNFFIDYLPQGTHVFEYTLIATMQGDCSNGLTSIQCMYAPEFSSHSEGSRVVVK